MSGQNDTFETLVQEAWAQGIQGWDWSYLDGRWEEEPLPWDYPSLVRACMANAGSLLDIGTGGGELLSSLGPFPHLAIATEAYPPSVGLAGQTLTPLGVTLLHTTDDTTVPLPLADDSLDLVINRHADHAAEELFRILRPGGCFLTQQVGGQNLFRLNEIFQEEPHFLYDYWTLGYAKHELEAAGFTILDAREAFPETCFLDIGAVVYLLKIIFWQVPGFDIHKDRATLKQVHAGIQQRGLLETHSDRFLIDALQPL